MTMRFEILLDHGESANKCTIAPLSYRKDFDIIPLQTHPDLPPLKSAMLLHHEGKVLTAQSLPSDTITIAAIDCVWRRLDTIVSKLSPVPKLIKIPEGFQTAYPRRSKFDFDPDGGLATIEALFIAAAFLGNWDLSLLKEYYFAERFLEINQAVFERYEVHSAKVPNSPIFQPSHQRNSQWRRQARGRVSYLPISKSSC